MTDVRPLNAGGRERAIDMALYKKEDYALMANRRSYAFQQIAALLGKDHAITKMMGPLAWGRNKAVPGMRRTLPRDVMEMGFLDGAFDILNLWARDNDPAAQRVMLDIYPSGYESAK